MKKRTQIVICGDICPTKDTEHFFKTANANGLFNNALPILQKADVLVGNLEFALTNTCAKVSKIGPVLKGATNYINLFTNVGFTALGLANNHIKDCGTLGVKNTLETCKNNNIATLGAGSNSEEAKKPLIIEKNDWKIGVMAFAEHEFNAAYTNEAGANLLDVFDDFDAIKVFKKQVDYLIILFHGGIEYYKYPSPLLQKKCKKMIDAGANFVTCQHSHVIGTEETYKQGTILYGQGNTVFGYKEHNSDWNKGLLVTIQLDENKMVSYIPIKATSSGIVTLPEVEKQQLLTMMEKRKKEIQQKRFIENSWSIFCESKKALYLPHLLGLGRILNKLNRIVGNNIISMFYSKKQQQIIQNLIRCESHNEVVKTILKKSNNN
ncbi:CapA family protein [Lutibacter sp.]